MKAIREKLHDAVVYCMLLIFKATVGIFTLMRFNVHLTRNDTKSLKGAYFLLSNHTNNYDPIFYQAYIPRVIHFVIADAVFRNVVLRRLLRFVGYIKKRKAVSDVSTIKNLLHYAKTGKIIGLFPEGNRNWDGQTMAFAPTTARLVKKLGVPVIAANIKGGFLSRPRWGGSLRRGRIEASLTCVLTPQQIKALTPEEIHQVLTEALFQDDLAWQAQRQIRYHSRRIAEDLELFLAACPSCHSFFTLRSSGNRFYCTHCGAWAEFDQFYTMQKAPAIPFTNIRAWGQWQEQYIRGQLLQSDGRKPVLEHDGAALYSSKSEKNYTVLAEGTLALYKDSLRFIAEDGSVTAFPIGEIQGVTVHFRRGLAFYYEYIDYRVLFGSGRVSAYFWTRALETAKEQATAVEETAAI